MKKYITYEEPLKGRSFTAQQMKEVYRDLADKKEYPVFSIWFLDMIRSGVFEEEISHGQADSTVRSSHKEP